MREREGKGEGDGGWRGGERWGGDSLNGLLGSDSDKRGLGKYAGGR